MNHGINDCKMIICETDKLLYSKGIMNLKHKASMLDVASIKEDLYSYINGYFTLDE